MSAVIRPKRQWVGLSSLGATHTNETEPPDRHLADFVNNDHISGAVARTAYIEIDNKPVLNQEPENKITGENVKCFAKITEPLISQIGKQFSIVNDIKDPLTPLNRPCAPTLRNACKLNKVRRILANREATHNSEFTRENVKLPKDENVPWDPGICSTLIDVCNEDQMSMNHYRCDTPINDVHY